jgi:hypothetical protein
VSDEAKAAEEIAKAAQPLTKALGQLVTDLLGPAFKEYGLRWGESAGRWREENTVLILESVNVKLRDRQIGGKTLPPRFLLPALEKASAVDEPALQELWAELIANGAEAEENRHPAFAQSLASMDGRDAAAFVAVLRIPGSDVSADMVFADPHPDDATPRLVALGLLELRDSTMTLGPRRRTPTPAELYKIMQRHQPQLTLRVSEYGLQFARAVGLLPTTETDRKR